MEATVSRRNDERGAILVIVLVIVSVVAILLGAILGEAQASLRNTQQVFDRTKKVYAADSGVDYTIKALSVDETLCPETFAPTTFQKVFNGKTVDITCTATTGVGTSVLGYAVITYDNSDDLGLVTQGGGIKTIGGPVYASRLAATVPNLVVNSGNLQEQKGNRCNSDADQPAGTTVSPSPPYSYRCTTLTPPAIPASQLLPTSIPGYAAQPPTLKPGTTDCTMFSPGKYDPTHPIVLTNRNYFATGLYYLKDIVLLVTSQEVVAGAPGPDIPQTGVAPCATDANVGTAAPGSGVKFVLGGTAQIIVTNPTGGFEAFSRRNSPSSEGQDRMNIVTVSTGLPGTWAGEGDTITPVIGPAVQVSGGANPALAFHGMVYTEQGLVDLSATNTSAALLQGGVVANRLKLQSSASAILLDVSTPGFVPMRRVVIDSRVKGVTNGGGRDVVATAVVDVSGVVNPSVTLLTWNTT